MLIRGPKKKFWLTGIAPYYKTAVSYQGPGDVVASAFAWGSPARAYSAAFAATAGSLIDIVDSAGANAATIHCLTTGFCDTATLAAYVVAHGAASVTKVYDQTGNGNHWTNATLAQMPVITQNALNSLPGLTFSSSFNGGVNFLATGSVSPGSGSQPVSFSTVAKRTANNTTAQGVIGVSGGAVLGFAGSANTIQVNGGSTGAATFSHSPETTDNAFHAMHGVLNGANSFASADGTDGSVATTTGGISAQTIRIGRANQCDAIVLEVGVWAAAFTGNPGGSSSGNTLAMNTNIHSATNGYNF